MSTDRFPERIGCRLPPGWPTRVELASATAGQAPDEWRRALIRCVLESADRAARRQRADERRSGS